MPCARADQHRVPSRTTRPVPRSSRQLCSARLGEAESRIEHQDRSGATPAASAASTARRSSSRTSATTSSYRRAHTCPCCVPRQCINITAAGIGGDPASRGSARPPDTSLIPARTGRERGLGDLRTGGVDGQRDVLGGKVGDHRHDPLHLGCPRPPGSRPVGSTRRRRRSAAHPAPHPPAVRQRGVDAHIPAAVGERVGSDVEDAHHTPVRGMPRRPLSQSSPADNQAHRFGPRRRTCSKTPRTAEVTVRAPGLRTPRIDIHICSHSITTITPCRAQPLHQRVGDLPGQPLLHLRAAGEPVHQPRQLRQSGDPAVVAGDVPDVRHAVERHQVMLAAGVELDVA